MEKNTPSYTFIIRRNNPRVEIDCPTVKEAFDQGNVPHRTHMEAGRPMAVEVYVKNEAGVFGPVLRP